MEETRSMRESDMWKMQINNKSYIQKCLDINGINKIIKTTHWHKMNVFCKRDKKFNKDRTTKCSTYNTKIIIKRNNNNRQRINTESSNNFNNNNNNEYNSSSDDSYHNRMQEYDFVENLQALKEHDMNIKKINNNTNNIKQVMEYVKSTKNEKIQQLKNQLSLKVMRGNSEQYHGEY